MESSQDASQHLRIKRSSKGDDGIIFAYLATKGQPQTDLACEAIRSYWLPLALKERGIKKKELKSVGQKAIAQLLQQVEVIRLECGLQVSEIPFGYSRGEVPDNTVATKSISIPASKESVDDEDDNNGDDDEEDNFAEDGEV